MSQNNILFSNKNAVHMICMILLAITLTACGGGGGGGSDPAPQNTAGPVDPVDPLPPGVDPGDPMPDPVDPGAGGGTPPVDESALFAATLHPVLINPGYTCVLCHNGTNLQAIPFAVADVASSYGVVTAQNIVATATPTQSTVYQRPLTNHNCGALCSTIAADVLQAINTWAAQSNNAGGQPPVGNVVASAMTNFSQVVEGSIPRADANMITLFAFGEGVGNTTVGTSNVGAGMTGYCAKYSDNSYTNSINGISKTTNQS